MVPKRNADRRSFGCMALTLISHRTNSGFLLPSIHSFPPFFTQQKNVTTQATSVDQWCRLLLSYARHRNLFFLKVDDAEVVGGDWDEILRNERINRRVLPDFLAFLLETLVVKNMASYEPPKQNRSVILYWRTPEEWGEVLHEWATSTGQLNTILTFYEITDPPVPSPLSGIPDVMIRRAIASLGRTARAQLIGVADGEGVRFFQGISR
ncbi:ESCRT-II complex, vps25 subunit [Fomitiporia mediterranea MF3/22]|uniref:ESCRT-II complex, vps25 subunit n=1 Tax=Fomitiporia mediterranea (strain MF3/22) TaxID=694068 RepID=UPI0004408B3E|nr:ESCRT-II complex, vps25 subunit [Fomitiporia mediterranea MF3/22]EJD07514.1 ESCRT-II complex, vps25 subunit [Fomitiporia mediterranea MF3/22]